jgi:hypothetical protein
MRLSVDLEQTTFLRTVIRSNFLFEHDLFGKPVPIFPDHALIFLARAAAPPNPALTSP